MTNSTKSAVEGVQTDVRLRAQAVMNIYVQNFRTKERLLESIAVEKKAAEDEMKRAEKELLEIGELNPKLFDADGNLNLGDGYIHKGGKTIVEVKRKFDAKVFANDFPEMFELEKAFKIDPLKKGFLDKIVRKELKAHGVELGIEDEMKVKVRKEGNTKLPE
jgi:hypothetical protein